MAANAANVLNLNTATTNVTTSAYVELTNSTSGSPIASSQISIWNGTSSIIKIAVGATGNQVDLIAVGPSEQVTIYVGLNVIQAGYHIWTEAVDATASTKYISVSLLP